MSAEPPHNLATGSAAERNLAPISDALMRVLPTQGTVLEIASGTGYHIANFSERFPRLLWQPSERTRAGVDAMKVSIARRPGRLALPMVLDVLDLWPDSQYAAILTINLLHISEARVTKQLFRQAFRHSEELIIYGPFRRAGKFSSRADRQFDTQLRTRNAQWGIRDLEEVTRHAIEAGWHTPEVIAMPANNYLLVFAPERKGSE